MKKVLGWIFNRWTLGSVLLLALSLIIWFVGPLVAIGELRPLDSERARWITILVLVLLFVLWAVWRTWRARRGNEVVVNQLLAAPQGEARTPQESADLAAVRQRFEQAMGTLRKARFGGGKNGGLGARLSGRYLYELP